MSKIRAFSIIELIFVIVILGLLANFARLDSKTPLFSIAKIVKQNIQYTRNLAMTQNTYYDNEKEARWLQEQFTKRINIKDLEKKSDLFWQIQFHLSGKYTTGSFSIYLDTPRKAKTTRFDRRPTSGDVIALSGLNLNCITGYNNTITDTFCKDNTDTTQRLLEKYKVSIYVGHQKNCNETDTARLYFDQKGMAYCGKTPTPITSDFIVILKKDDETQKICVKSDGQIAENKQCKA